MNSHAAALAYEIAHLPERALPRVAKSLAPIFQAYAPSIVLSEEDIRDLALSEVEAANGDFATDAEVAAAFRTIHAAVGL